MDFKTLMARPQLAFLILVNLFPVFGVLVWGWQVSTLVFLYWAENVIIGAYIILRELLTTPMSQIFGKLFLLTFFLIHYGGFCAGHGMLILELFDLGEFNHSIGKDWPLFLVFVGLLFSVIYSFAEYLNPSLSPFIVGIGVYYGWRLVVDIFNPSVNESDLAEESVVRLKDSSTHVGIAEKTLSPEEMTAKNVSAKKSQAWMVEPYKRIVILHVTLLAGGLGIQILGSPWPLLVILIGLKIVIEIYLLRGEMGKNARIPTTS